MRAQVRPRATPDRGPVRARARPRHPARQCDGRGGSSCARGSCNTVATRGDRRTHSPQGSRADTPQDSFRHWGSRSPSPSGPAARPAGSPNDRPRTDGSGVDCVSGAAPGPHGRRGRVAAPDRPPPRRGCRPRGEPSRPGFVSRRAPRPMTALDRTCTRGGRAEAHRRPRRALDRISVPPDHRGPHTAGAPDAGRVPPEAARHPHVHRPRAAARPRCRDAAHNGAAHNGAAHNGAAHTDAAPMVRRTTVRRTKVRRMTVRRTTARRTKVLRPTVPRPTAGTCPIARSRPTAPEPTAARTARHCAASSPRSRRSTAPRPSRSAPSTSTFDGCA